MALVSTFLSAKISDTVMQYSDNKLSDINKKLNVHLNTNHVLHRLLKQVDTHYRKMFFVCNTNVTRNNTELTRVNVAHADLL